jgi:Uri superfamily endonuclease
MHWHIDYLTTSKNITIKSAIYSGADTKEFECRLSTKISTLGFSRTITSFGSSDCKQGCKSHLFMLDARSRLVTSSIIEIYNNLGLRPLLYRRR